MGAVVAEMPGGKLLTPDLFRYGLAAIGPVAAAGAQFILSLLLLHLLSPGAFGSFSFLLVTSIFSAGLWAGLFCAPLPILMNKGDAASRERSAQSLITLSTAGAVFVFLAFTAIGLALSVPLGGALLFGVYAAMFVIRWFARAYAYAIGAPMRVTASDLVYSGTLLLGIGIIAFLGIASVELCYGAMALSAALGLLPFGGDYLARQFLTFDTQAFRHYVPIWREHSGWSLMGIVTTEATINAHVYIVTLFAGPTAYAPIAATALMIRPIGVAQNALGDFERARMARQIGQGGISQAIRAVRFFRLVLLAAWIATCLAVLAMFAINPHAVFPAHYDLRVLATGSILWLAVSGIRLVRTPESTLLQAAGAFRPLAQASMLACGFSVLSVAALLAFVGPLWSIAGIILGESVFCLWTWTQARKWRTNAMAAYAKQSTDGSPIEPSSEAERLVNAESAQ